jgi:hypothetical protein
VAISFSLHSELDILTDPVLVVKEFSQVAGSMWWPDDERVVYVVKPADRLMGRSLQSHLFKAPHEIVCND